MFKGILILLLSVSVSWAVIWNEGATGELHWGEQLSAGNYIMKLEDFSIAESSKEASKVLIDLQEDNISIARRILGSGESFIINDSIKVTVNDIVLGEIEDDPYADLRIQLPAAPEISLILVGDRYVCQGGDELTLHLRVENRGTVDVENMKITLDTIPPCIRKRFSISELPAGMEWDDKKKTKAIDPIKINFKAPYLDEPGDLKIQVHAEYTNSQEKVYRSFGGETIHILGPLQLHKRIQEIQEFGNSYSVINSLSNTGNSTLNIRISDSAGPNFLANETLSWNINLKPGEEKIISYSIKAIKPVIGLDLEDAQATYRLGDREYTVSSEKPVVDIIGPFIEVRRSIDPSRIKIGEEATVSTELENTGNRKAAATLYEYAIDGIKLVSGKDNESFILAPGESTFKETQLLGITPCFQNIPASVRYRDIRGNEYSSTVPALRIEVLADSRRDQSASDLKGISLNRTGLTNESSMGRAEDKSEKWDFLAILFIAIVILISNVISRYP